MYHKDVGSQLYKEDLVYVNTFHDFISLQDKFILCRKYLYFLNIILSPLKFNQSALTIKN